MKKYPKVFVNYSIRRCNILDRFESGDWKQSTHFEPSELTEPSLDSFELCFVSLGLFVGITSVLRWTPLVSVLFPPRIQSKNRGQGVQ